MKQVRVEVEYIPSSQGIIDNINLPTGNNISNNQASLREINGGSRCFVLGASKLGTDPFYNNKNKYNGFFSNILTSANGTADITITISGASIDNFVVNFDSVAGQWATEIVVDGAVWKNQNSLFFWHGTSANTHTIKITKWNKPRYPVRITSLLVGITINYDNSCLYEVARGSQCMANNRLPTYGIVSQYGKVVFIDRHKELLKLAELKLLKPDLNLKIFYGTEQIGDFVSEKWSYAYDNGKAEVELKDTTQQWHDKTFERYTNIIKNETALSIYNKLKAESYEDFVPLTTVQTNYLSGIVIAFSYFERCSLIEAWNKLCNLAQLQLYKREDGKIITQRWQ